MTGRFRSQVTVLSLAFAGIFASGPAFAQVDLSGYWANRPHEDNMARGPGLEFGEFEGYSLNAASRMKASSWNAANMANPERQCIPMDIVVANSGFRIWREVDPASQEDIAWHIHLDYLSQDRTIWMDGRPHPSEYAAHTFQGFSTGKWEGNQLVVTTTHLKQNVIERNGVARSDQATFIEYFISRGDILTVVHIVHDPVWLEEPFIQSRDFARVDGAHPGGYACLPHVEVMNRPPGDVLHYLPGKNPYLFDATTRFGVPPAAVRGGAETTYPEYQLKLKDASFANKRSVDLPPATPAASQPNPPAAMPPDFDKVNMSVLPVQGNVYMLVGAGGNTTVQVGEYSVLVVDTQFAPLSAKLLAAIKQISNKPIRYVVNTSADQDHIGGNEPIAKAGNSIGSDANEAFGGGNIAAYSAAGVIAHENVLKRVSAPTGKLSMLPYAAWPTESFATPDYRLFNGEAVRIIHEPAAHTDGDSIVFFRRSDVISTGDIFTTTGYPVIDRKSGGSITGEIAALNQIIDLSIPRDKQEGGTFIVPGHGRICDQADVVEYRDMVTIIRDRIQDMAKRGMTLEQVQAERPTFDYDPRYGAPTPRWTKDMFVEAIYRDVSGKND